VALAHFQMTQCSSRDFCLQQRYYISHFFGELKFDRQILPTSCIPLYYLETEIPIHLSLLLLRLKTAAKHTAIVANVNKCAKTTSGSKWHSVT